MCLAQHTYFLDQINRITNLEYPPNRCVVCVGTRTVAAQISLAVSTAPARTLSWGLRMARNGS